MLYLVIYNNKCLDEIVSSHEEAEELVINKYGIYDYDELFIEEI